MGLTNVSYTIFDLIWSLVRMPLAKDGHTMSSTGEHTGKPIPHAFNRSTWRGWHRQKRATEDRDAQWSLGMSVVEEGHSVNFPFALSCNSRAFMIERNSYHERSLQKQYPA